MLGMAIKLNLVTPPPNANPALLKQPRKVVPNARATPALQFQPHFEDAVSATQHELTMDVQIHPPVDTPPASPSSYQTLASPPSIISQQPLQQVPPTRKTRSNRAGKKPGPSSQQGWQGCHQQKLQSQILEREIRRLCPRPPTSLLRRIE